MVGGPGGRPPGRVPCQLRRGAVNMIARVLRARVSRSTHMHCLVSLHCQCRLDPRVRPCSTVLVHRFKLPVSESDQCISESQ